MFTCGRAHAFLIATWFSEDNINIKYNIGWIGVNLITNICSHQKARWLCLALHILQPCTYSTWSPPEKDRVGSLSIIWINIMFFLLSHQLIRNTNYEDTLSEIILPAGCFCFLFVFIYLFYLNKHSVGLWKRN